MNILKTDFFDRGTDGLFASMGNYSEQMKDDLNLPECGFGLVPIYFKISYEKQCFSRSYPNKTLIIFHKWKGGVGKVSSRIYQGREARVGDSPWTVFLDFEKGVCSGVLITYEWVLTSAHCLNDMVRRRFI